MKNLEQIKERVASLRGACEDGECSTKDAAESLEGIEKALGEIIDMGTGNWDGYTTSDELRHELRAPMQEEMEASRCSGSARGEHCPCRAHPCQTCCYCGLARVRKPCQG